MGDAKKTGVYKSGFFLAFTLTEEDIKFTTGKHVGKMFRGHPYMMSALRGEGG